MDIIEEIYKIIDAISETPNCLARNKALSALQDARVWSEELDVVFEPKDAQNGCVCPTGGIRNGCPVHGSVK